MAANGGGSAWAPIIPATPGYEEQAGECNLHCSHLLMNSSQSATASTEVQQPAAPAVNSS